MAKRVVLMMTEELFKHTMEQAAKLGITPLEYIRYLIMKDKESKARE